MKTNKILLNTLIASIAIPIVCVVMAAVALYIPSVQNWAVGKAGKYASEKTGMNISVGEVRLAFPLDLRMDNVKCIKHNDSLPQRLDTIANIQRTVVDVKLWPLLDNTIEINALEINNASINTIDFIPQARVKGHIGRLMLNTTQSLFGKMHTNESSTVADVNLNENVIKMHTVIIDNAHIDIALQDSTSEDTTTTENQWIISMEKLILQQSDVTLHTIGDTLAIKVGLGDLTATNGLFDLGKGKYAISNISLSKCTANYDNNIAIRSKTLPDLDHLGLSDISLAIDSIEYSDKAGTCLKIKSGQMKERCGLDVKQIKADVNIDSAHIDLKALIATKSSYIYADTKFDFSAFTPKTQGRLQADVDANIAYDDITRYAFSFASLPQSFINAWPRQKLKIKVAATGNVNHITIANLTAELPTAFTLQAHGESSGFMNLSGDIFSREFKANLTAHLNTYNLNFIKTLLPSSIANSFRLPKTSMVADLNIYGPEYNLQLTAREAKGTLKGKARLNAAQMAYSASMQASNINAGHFVCGLNVGNFTGNIILSGQGTDPYSNSTRANADAVIKKFRYGAYNLNNVTAKASIKKGHAYAGIIANNDLIKGAVSVDALLNSKNTEFTLSTDLSTLDLGKLGITDNQLTAGLCAHLDIATNMRDLYKAQGSISDITLRDSDNTYRPDDITLNAFTRRDTTILSMLCGDFNADLHAQGGYEWLMGCTDRITATIKNQFETRTIDQAELRKQFPQLTLKLHSGQENPIFRMAKFYGVDYTSVDADISTSMEDGINGYLNFNGLAAQGYKLDTITAKVKSLNDPYKITYEVYIQNTPPNDYVFSACFNGEILEHGLDIYTKLYDNKQRLALSLGTEATMLEQGINVHFTPLTAILGYENFNINKNNYILLGKRNRIYADLALLANDGTGIKLYSTEQMKMENDENVDSDSGEGDSELTTNSYLQDLTLSINKLNIGKILAVLPYAPNMKGILDGDYHIVQNQNSTFTLSSDMTVSNMVYEGCDIGNLGTQITYFPKDDGSHYVDGTISLDGNEIGKLAGAYNFDTDAIDAKLQLLKFPMQTINGFITDQIIGLEGTADGTLTVQGTSKAPIVNGEMFLENASLISVPYGVKMKFDDDPVRIQNSKLLFENFQMYAYNNQPLICKGELDFSNLEHVNLDMKIKATNLLLIDAKENKRSEAYGKLYVNFYAMMQGELDKLHMQGKLDVLPSTNVYYILKDSPLNTDNKLQELVTFTDLAAEQPINIIRPAVEGLNVSLAVTVKDGAEITCWLNGNHSNYVNVIGEGDLRLVILADNMNLTGRYTITKGEMKYSLPIIPLKTFKIEDGSYMEFTGDITNPKLAITATEEMRSACDVNGTSQIVSFNTGVKISKTLNDMGLEFIIEAPENERISSDLAQMSTEERAKIAVTMLTTGMYISDGNTSKFSMNSALNSFLQSEINNIAGSALKTIDMSFGMDNSTDETGNLHTDYTFKFAKRFWNNRLAISVGGKISTGPDVSGQNKSFFDNVDVQYRLSDNSSQYLQLFYKRAVYDFLEGYVGKYGAGYMYKKKMQSLGELFRTTANENKQTQK